MKIHREDSARRTAPLLKMYTYRTMPYTDSVTVTADLPRQDNGQCHYCGFTKKAKCHKHHAITEDSQRSDNSSKLQMIKRTEVKGTHTLMNCN